MYYTRSALPYLKEIKVINKRKNYTFVFTVHLLLNVKYNYTWCKGI
jgi:hypothetical protein